jgi:hypothetical protein
MNLIVWNIPERCTEQQVRDFLSHELGHYAKDISVYESGTDNAYAKVELNAETPYAGEAIASQLQGRRLEGVQLRVSAAPFDEREARRPE